MTVFIFFNWFLCITTSTLLSVSLWRYRYLLVKPSIVVILFSHLTIQWAATVDSAHIEEYLPNPWVFVLLTHGFPLIGFAVSFFTGNSQSRAIWRRIVHPRPVSPRVRRKAMLVLGGCIMLIIAFYLSRVSFSSLGLVTMFVAPTSTALAREHSLKLVSSVALKYSYRFTISVFAPLLVVMLAERLSRSLRQKRLLWSFNAAIGMAGILFVVSLSGAKGVRCNDCLDHSVGLAFEERDAGQAGLY